MALRLRCINIENFKSFKGKHTIDNLSTHLNAIVGPNGCGKSNIIDSVLFVLGYRAKKMRHDNIKNLITNGCTECSVELVFDDFKISRSIRGASKYYLNSQEISSADAASFLREKGIDLDHNRFLILQGEIEKIAAMSPLELLGYIEDCIGTGGYKQEIEEIDANLNRAEDDRVLAADKLGFIESDYKFKKGKIDEKNELLERKHSSLKLKKRIVQMKEELARRKARKLKDELGEMRKELEGFKSKGTALKKAIGQLEKSCGDLDLQRKQEEYLDAKRLVQRIQQRDKLNERKINDIQKKIAELQEEIVQEQEAIQERAKIERELEENQRELGELRRKTKELELQYQTDEDAKKIEKTIQESEKCVVELLREKEEYVKQECAILALKEKIAKLESECLEKGDIKDTGSLEAELGRLESDMRSTRQEIARRKARADEYRMVESAYRREQEVENALRGVGGVHGPLKRLGSVSSRYEKAMSAAAKSMASIVVDTTSVAEECIRIINRQKLARTTFIILDRIKASIVEEEGLLFNEIDTADEYRRAFWFSVQDTLVASTTEDARRLAFGRVRRRVVTLDGQLFEKSGIMCGGKVSAKIKSVEELESIYSNMQRMHEEKRGELESARAAEKQRMNADKNRAAIGRMQREMRGIHFDAERMSRIDEEIEKAKAGIQSCFSQKCSERTQKLRRCIQELRERAENIEKTNQEHRIALCSTLKSDDARRKEDEIRVLANEGKALEGERRATNVDDQEMRSLEEAYNSCCEAHKKIQDEIAELRAAMRSAYHEEVEHKNRMEETDDKIAESEKIEGNCREKLDMLLKEDDMIRSLLGRKCDEDRCNFGGMDENEIRNESRKLIDKLGEKEAGDFEDLKGRHTRNLGMTMDDYDVYKEMYQEYENIKKGYGNAKSAYESLSGKVTGYRQEKANLEARRQEEFMEAFGVINKNLKSIFSRITTGGNAELELVDFLDPFKDGLNLNIMPPRKAWKPISQLSGGEKTLSSLSLIFALHKYRPSSLYILDEIDAALDHRNVQIIAEYLSGIDAQCLLISLRNEMFERAKTLVGVYKVQEQSQLLVVNVDNMQ